MINNKLFRNNLKIRTGVMVSCRKKSMIILKPSGIFDRSGSLTKYKIQKAVTRIKILKVKFTK